MLFIKLSNSLYGFGVIDIVVVGCVFFIVVIVCLSELSIDSVSSILSVAPSKILLRFLCAVRRGYVDGFPETKIDFFF